MPTPRLKSHTPSRTSEQPARSLAIMYRAIAELKPDPKNPCQHSAKQIQQIARSIEAFGFNVPFLVDHELRLIAGHGRLDACKLLKIEQVPTICLDHLSQAQIRAFMIADNRLTENATWDEHLLAEQFQELSDLDLDFSLEATGFDMAEIDILIDGLSLADDANDPGDVAPEPGPSAITQPGDMWLLGRNRVICGNALNEPVFANLMDGRVAAAVFVDPPYNDPIDGYVTGFGKVHHREFAMASGEMSEAQFTEFLRKAFAHLVRHSAPGTLHFVCMDWRHTRELLVAGEVYTELKNICVWVKDNGGQGSLYRSQHEFVFVFKAGKERHRNNIQLGQYGRTRTNVWNYPRVSGLAKPTEEGLLATLHPTVKPVALVADAILDCTERGEIVLDSFLGSGTTLIAAERTGRLCHGIELDPVYVDVAIRRWQKLTGLTAVHAQSGQSFAQIEEARHGQQ